MKTSGFPAFAKGLSVKCHARIATCSLVAMVLASISTAALAADTSETDSGDPFTSDIIVTAQKRSERLSDVPLSITAVSGDQLNRQGITSVEQLDRVVPGFTYQKAVYGAPVFAIRGIGFYDQSVTNTPAVAVYLDQVPLPYSAMARGVSLDLERVEALKGPQGTLFGQNATGGAINYIAAKPGEAMAAGFDLDYGRFNEINAQAFVGGPITNTLKGRIAVRAEYRDEWQRGFETNDNQRGQSGATLGERKFYNARAMLDWTPTETLTIAVSATGWIDKSDTQAAQFVRFAPTSPQNPFNGGVYAAYANFVTTPRNSRLAGWNDEIDFGRDDHFYQFSLRGDLELGDFTLTSISAYNRFHENSRTDSDGTAYLDQVQNPQVDIEGYFQELRLAGEVGSASITLGLNYSNDDSIEQHFATLGATNSGLGPARYSAVMLDKSQDTEIWAAFASVDYEIVDDLTLQLGGRYTSQTRDFKGCLRDPGYGGLAAAINFGFNGGATPGNCVTLDSPATNRSVDIVARTLDEDNFSWRANLSWKPSIDSLIYAGVTKGYKGGGFPLVPGLYVSQFAPITQESLIAYEAGFKTAFADRRISLSGAVYHYNYSDKQLLGYLALPPFGNLPALLNIPKSRVNGAELEAVLLPVEGLRISAGLSYVDSKVQEDPANPIDPLGVRTSFIGERFPNTPKWQAMVDAEYRVPVGGGIELFIGGSSSSRSKSQAAFGDVAEFVIPGYTLLDVRAGLAAEDGSWRVQAWGRNVTNKFYQTNILHQVDSITYYTGMPATYGLSFSYRY